MLTMHVQVTEQTEDRTDVVRRIKKMLKLNEGIGHSTVEVETDGCADH
jgi:Co/Zn/Cd efflux system component